MGIQFPNIPGFGGGGNYGFNVSKPEEQTTHYLDLIKRAGGEDDKLQLDELNTEISALSDQQDLIDTVIETFGDMFGGYAKSFFQAIKKQVDIKLDVANRVKDNFGTFDAGENPDGGIERDEVLDVARNDGNVYDISNRDLGIPVGTPTDTMSYYRFFQGADKKGGYWPGMGDGKLTGEEITDHIDHLTEQKDYYESLKDIYPDYYHYYINQAIDKIQSQINVGTRMSTNFNALDNANDDNELDEKISYQELYNAANRDDNPYDLTDADLLINPGQ